MNPLDIFSVIAGGTVVLVTCVCMVYWTVQYVKNN